MTTEKGRTVSVGSTVGLAVSGARYHKPASTYKKLFGGIGYHREQNLRVIDSDSETVTFNHDGKIDSMDRATFLRLARKSIAAGAQFFPANDKLTHSPS